MHRKGSDVAQMLKLSACVWLYGFKALPVQSRPRPALSSESDACMGSMHRHAAHSGMRPSLSLACLDSAPESGSGRTYIYRALAYFTLFRDSGILVR